MDQRKKLADKLLVFKVEMKHPRKIAAAVWTSVLVNTTNCVKLWQDFLHFTSLNMCVALKILSLSDDISQIYFLQGKIISYICATWHHVFKIKLSHATGTHWLEVATKILMWLPQRVALQAWFSWIFCN